MPAQSVDARLLQLLFATGAGAPSLEVKLARLVEERRRSGEHSASLDRALLEELAVWRGRVDEAVSGLAELREAQDGLRAVVEKLLEPSLREARYLGTISYGDEQLAVVHHENGHRLVRVKDLPLAELVPGEVVYLADAGNVALARGQALPACGEVAAVEEVVGADRLIIRRGGEERVVLRGPALRGADVKMGDRVVWDPASNFALEALPATQAQRWLMEELPDVPRTALAGFGSQRDKILSQFVMSVSHPEVAALYGIDGHRTLLLYGPPGCGKTTLMRVISSELGRTAGARCRVAIVNAAQLERPYVGETQQQIHSLFRELAAVDGPKLLFLDEVDAIGRIRGGPMGHHSDKFLSAWLTELDGLRSQKGLAIVAATNRKDLIDAALLERLSALELNVPRPGMSATREILRVHLSESVPVAPNGAAAPSSREEMIDVAVARLFAPNADNQLARLRFRDARERVVSAKDLISGRVCRQICVAARTAASLRHAAGGPAGVTLADVEEAVSDALDRMSTLLTPRNVRSHIQDLPDDVDVLAVDRLRSPLRAERYRAPRAAAHA